MEIEKNPQAKQKAEEHKNQGNTYFKNKNYANAIEQYTKAINEYPQEPNYYSNRAACYLSLKKYNMCIQDCIKALEIDPKLVKVLRRLGKSNMQLGKLKESKSALQQAYDIDPKDTQIKDDLKELKRLDDLYNDYQSSVKKFEFESAVKSLNQILEFIDGWESLALERVECLAKAGNTDDAMKYFQQLDQSRYPKCELFYLKGIISLYSGDSGKAKLAFQEGTKCDPDNKKCQIVFKQARLCEQKKEQGNEEIKQKNYEKAIEIYTEALNQDSFNRKMNSIIYSNRALAYLRKGDLAQAEKDCNKSIELNPKYAKSYLRRAEIRMKNSQFDDAIADYNEVRQLDPTSDVTQLIREAQKASKQAKKKDYYKILELERNATPEDIKKQYRKLALLWHPDKHNQSDETRKVASQKFKDIAESYKVLSDPKKKQMFDQGIDPEGQQGFDFGEGFNPFDIFSSFMGGQGSSQQTYFTSDNSGGFGGFENLFGGQFSQAQGHKTKFPGGSQFSFRFG